MIESNSKISRQDKFRLFAREVGQLFSVKQAQTVLGVSAQASAQTLARWHHQGFIARIVPGLYALVPNDTLIADFMLEDPWLLIPKLFDPGYIGGWTASEYWDLTEQIFNTLMVFTTLPVPHKQQKIGAQSFQIKHIQASRLFGLEPIWRGQEKIMISDMHRTIIDLFNEPETAGGQQHSVDCLKNYLKNSESNLGKLSQYANKIQNGALYKRLGFLLEKIIEKNHPIIDHFHTKITKGYSYLNPTEKENNRLVQRWSLFVPKSFNLEQ